MSAAGMQVRCWGVRGSHPVTDPAMARHGGNTPCVEVVTGQDRRLVIDAGTGIIGLGRSLVSAGVTGRLEVDLLLSHLHWDHLQGLPFFAPLYRPLRLRVWSGHPVDQVVAATRMQLSAPYFPVDLESLDVELTVQALEEPRTIAGAVVSPIALQHPGGCTGYRIACNDRVMLFASDHEIGDPEIDEEVVGAAREADLVCLDAQYDAAELPGHEGWGHSSWQDAVDLALRARARRLLLFHHDPGADDALLDRVSAAAGARMSGAETAVERRTYSLEAE